MGKDHVCIGMAHVEREARGVHVLRKMVARERMPQPVIRPLRESGGPSYSLASRMILACGPWPELAAKSGIRRKPLYEVGGEFYQPTLRGLALLCGHFQVLTVKQVNVFPFQPQELGSAQPGKGADGKAGEELRWCVLKQPLQLVGREYLGWFVYAFNPLDCRNWIDGHVATLDAEIEQTSQRSSEVVHRLRGKPQVQKARNFSGADALHLP